MSQTLYLFLFGRRLELRDGRARIFFAKVGVGQCAAEIEMGVCELVVLGNTL
jgi:hypothetical protein